MSENQGLRLTDQTRLWMRVDEMVAQAPSVGALRHHRIELLAARQLRQRGARPQPELRAAERLAALRALAVPHLLERIRDATDEPLVLMKGAEAACSYQHSECRGFGDLDLFTVDADAVSAALLRAGFIETGGCVAAHHAPPLAWPGVPLAIELHRAPKYVPGLAAPSTDALMNLTRPSRTGAAGVAGFVPEAHAILLAVHAWAHSPLARVGQLIDVAAVLAEGDRYRADHLADSWGCQRLWRSTIAAIDGLLGTGEISTPVRTWARHLLATREPRVAEQYAARLAAPAWAQPRERAPGAIGAELLRTIRPYEWESWSDQLPRSLRALRHTFHPLSEFQT